MHAPHARVQCADVLTCPLASSPTAHTVLNMDPKWVARCSPADSRPTCGMPSADRCVCVCVHVCVCVCGCVCVCVHVCVCGVGGGITQTLMSMRHQHTSPRTHNRKLNPNQPHTHSTHRACVCMSTHTHTHKHMNSAHLIFRHRPNKQVSTRRSPQQNT